MQQFEKYSVRLSRVQFRWLLRDDAGALFCQGTHYGTKNERDKALAVIRSRFPEVPVVDLDKH